MSIGVAEDVLLRLDRHIIPIDVTILDMSEDEKLSIILGIPFLNTVGATLDCAEGKVTFRIYDEGIVEKCVPPQNIICAVSEKEHRPPRFCVWYEGMRSSLAT